MSVLLGVGGSRLLVGASTPAETVDRTVAMHPASGSQRGTDLDPLQRALEAEIEARAALALEVARVQEQPARLVAGSEGAESKAVAPGGRSPEGPGPEPVAATGGGDPRAEVRPAFATEVLIVAGVDPVDAERLRERSEDFEMEKLELAHRSVNEAWPLSPQYRSELRALEQAMHEDLGDQTYDLLLFATGQTNRVVVCDVLERSPARDVGLEPGDTILSYDGERGFRVGELRRATTLGEPGEFVRIEVVRDGQSRELYVPRGPLGVFLKRERCSPTRG